MSSRRWLLAALLAASCLVTLDRSVAQEYEPKPADPALARFRPLKAPAPGPLLLRPGDRLAICGDSITEQKMYSRIIETYLTACMPELGVVVRQYGWSGETAPGFLGRMTNDCLRFHPTVATLCYGMNDHGYRAYETALGERYRQAMEGIVGAFKGAGVRVVVGSPGCVGKVPHWVKEAKGTVEDLNLSLCEFRNLDVNLSAREGTAFADVFWPMLRADVDAKQRFGADFAVAGKDGVHPDWSGQLIMAYAFLKGMGLNGDLGTITVDLGAKQATATGGHQVQGFDGKELRLVSSRYPFCAAGAVDKDNSIRAGMALVPFNQELNRLRLVVKAGKGDRYKVVWGKTTRSYSAAQLAAGVNLAEDFPENPFSEAFGRVDRAVEAKQAYETRQIKDLFHGPEGRTDADATAALTEKVRAPLAEAVRGSLKPVEHALSIEAE